MNGHLIARCLLWLLLAMAAGKAHAANIALNARVEASSQLADYKAAYAVDGKLNDTSRRWLNATTDDHPWIHIEFGSPRRIQGVRVIFDQTGGMPAIASSFQIEDFGDGRLRKVLGKLDRNSEIGPYILFDPVVTDQVRVRWSKNGVLQNINRIMKIEVYDTEEDLSGVQRTYPYAHLQLYPDLRQLAIIYRFGDSPPAERKICELEIRPANAPPGKQLQYQTGYPDIVSVDPARLVVAFRQPDVTMLDLRPGLTYSHVFQRYVAANIVRVVSSK